MLPVCIVLLLAGGCAGQVASDTLPKPPLQGVVIALDPGHGGIDHGAVSPHGVLEDKLNLQISLLVRDLLLRSGATVVMTRDGDDVNYNSTGNTRKRKDMNSRAALLQQNSPNAIISVHMNKYPKSKYHGSRTFYWKGDEQGKHLAECIQDALETGLPNNPESAPRSGNYFILHAHTAPATLVECGFLSNPTDEKNLQDPDYQRKVAESITAGIHAFFGVNWFPPDQSASG